MSVSASTSTSETPLPLQPRRALGAEDVDPPLEQAAAEGHLVLLLRQLVDQRLQVVVGERGEIGKRFHEHLSGG